MIDFVIVRLMWGVIETFATIQEATEYALRRGIKTIEVIFTEYTNGEPMTYGKILTI